MQLTKQRPHGAKPARQNARQSCTQWQTASTKTSKRSPLLKPGTTASQSAKPSHADIPLAADHLRYFASAIRTQEGHLSQLDEDTVAYHFHEPLGVVGQIIPWNFPILMAIWKLAPALAAGNAVVLKPAEQTPASIMVLMEIVGDLLPPGVVNVVNDRLPSEEYCAWRR